MLSIWKTKSTPSIAHFRNTVSDYILTTPFI
jgi:hypothetical protein